MTLFVVLEWVPLLAAVEIARLVRFGERRLVIVPRLLFRLGFLVGEVQTQLLQRFLERLVVVLPPAPAFLEGTLHAFLLAAIVLVQLVPQRLRGFRVWLDAGRFILGERNRRMFRRPLQDTVDLRS